MVYIYTVDQMVYIYSAPNGVYSYSGPNGVYLYNAPEWWRWWATTSGSGGDCTALH